jgi:hypothetical protein
VAEDHSRDYERGHNSPHDQVAIVWPVKHSFIEAQVTAHISTQRELKESQKAQAGYWEDQTSQYSTARGGSEENCEAATDNGCQQARL